MNLKIVGEAGDWPTAFAQEQAAQSVGAAAFISKNETSERAIERLRFAVDTLK